MLQEDEDVQLERRGDLLAPLKVSASGVVLLSSLADCFTAST